MSNEIENDDYNQIMCFKKVLNKHLFIALPHTNLDVMIG